jgi:heme exporter protein CcmD
MSVLGAHGDFIIAAYAAALFVMLLMICWERIDHRRQKQILADLYRRGITLRSKRQDPS